MLKKHSQKQVVSDDLKEWFLPELTVAWFLQSVNLKCPINTSALNLCEPLFPPPQKKDNAAAWLVDTFKNRGKRTMATSPSSHNRCSCKFSSKGKMKPSWTRTCWTRTTAPLERRLQWRFMDSQVHVQTATTDGPTAHRKHTCTFQRLFSAQLKPFCPTLNANQNVIVSLLIPKLCNLRKHCSNNTPLMYCTNFNTVSFKKIF